MLKRQLVLVAIDRASDVERTMGVALSAAKAREADVHAIHVVPRKPVHVDDRTGRWTFSPDGGRRAAMERVASMPRSAGHEGVRVRSVTLRGQPEQVIPAYAQLNQAALLVIERDYGRSWFWQNGRGVTAARVTSGGSLRVEAQRR